MTYSALRMASAVLSVELTADTPPVEVTESTHFSLCGGVVSPQRGLCPSPDMPESSPLSWTAGNTHDIHTICSTVGVIPDLVLLSQSLQQRFMGGKVLPESASLHS